jgi:hypothetical protein
VEAAWTSFEDVGSDSEGGPVADVEALVMGSGSGGAFSSVTSSVIAGVAATARIEAVLVALTETAEAVETVMFDSAMSVASALVAAVVVKLGVAFAPGWVPSFVLPTLRDAAY